MLDLDYSLDSLLDLMMDSDKDLLTSLPSTSVPSSPAPDVSAHCSCTRCTRRMSSYKYDKHSLCLNCRDVQCSLDVRCNECKSWSSEVMLDYLKHRKSLVSKGKKKLTMPSLLLLLLLRCHPLLPLPLL